MASPFKTPWHFDKFRKDEEGEYVFEGRDAVDYIMSKGTSWYNNYGVKVMQLSGYAEEFRATKK